ncbi:MAG: hypothetical protein SGBAC_010237, partial [Bacillariaceae sp.]
MSVLLFIFGVGVGGEYPLSASSASEKAMEQLLQQKKLEDLGPTSDSAAFLADQSDRGRQIQLVFTMQGMGIWLQTIILMLLLIVFGQAKAAKDSYDKTALTNVWRVSYFLGAAVLFYVFISRYLYLEESEVWSHDKGQRERQSRQERCHGRGQERPANTTAPINILFREYWARLVGASLSWGLWDISFYGNKLFQSSFLLAVAGKNISLFEYTLAAVLNSTVALFGYFGAAFLVDHSRVGRLWLQASGFLVTGVLFLLCAFALGDIKNSVS